MHKRKLKGSRSLSKFGIDTLLPDNPIYPTIQHCKTYFTIFFWGDKDLKLQHSEKQSIYFSKIPEKSGHSVDIPQAVTVAKASHPTANIKSCDFSLVIRYGHAKIVIP